MEVEVYTVRVIFIAIIVWNFYEVWKLNQLIGSARLGRFLRKVGIAIAAWVIASIGISILRAHIGWTTLIPSALIQFVFFSYLALLVRSRRRRLTIAWADSTSDRDEAIEAFEEILDILKIEKVKAIRGAR